MNKKVFIAIAAGTLLFTGCNKSEFNISPDNSYVTVNATISDATKSVEETGTFYWTAGDQIDIWYTDGSSNTKTTFSLELQQGEEKVTSGIFKGTVAGEKQSTGYAVYPAGNHSIDNNGTITVNMPATYGNAETEYTPNTNAAMIAVPAAVAANTESSAPNLSFKHVGGVLCFTVKNVPASASQFIFTANMSVTGNFAVTDGKITASGSEATNNTVTINFKPLTEAQSSMTFYVPLPTGTYEGFKAEIKNSDASQTYMSYTTDATNSLNRAGIARITLAITNVQAGTPIVAQTVVTAQALNDALENTTSGQESYIIVQENNMSVSSLPVADGAKVTLDLNGKTLNINGQNTVVANTKSGGTTINHGIVNNGTLTIENGSINYNTGSSDFNNKYAIYNTGVLTLTNTSITSDKGVIYTVGTWDNTKQTLAEQGDPSVITTIDGGNLTSTNTQLGPNGGHLYAVGIIDNALLTVKGNATIKGDGAITINCSKLNINGATLTATGNSGHCLYIAGAADITTENTTLEAPGAKVVAYSGSNAKYGVINYNDNKLNNTGSDGITVPADVVVKLVNENAAPTITGPIINRGTLYITGGSVNYTAAESEFSDLNSKVAITNYGILNLSGTDVTSNTYAIINYGTWTNNVTLENQGETKVTATINGGTISSTVTAHGSTGQHIYALYTSDNALMNITGATITGDGGIAVNCSKLNVTNSTITTNCTNNSTYGIYALSAANVTASGNTINASSNNKVYLHRNKSEYGKLIYNNTEYTANTIVNDSNNY